MVGASLYTANLLVFVHGASYFREEDFDTMWLASVLPFDELLLLGIDEHFVPLHRLVSYVLYELAPMDFGAALLVLFGFQLLGVIYLYRVLKVVETSHISVSGSELPEPITAATNGLLLNRIESWVLLGLYCTYVYLGVLFLWFTAGLHRLPYIAASLIAMYHYLRYRHGRRLLDSLICFAATLCGFGFFTKGVLIPVYLLALELCFWKNTTAPARRTNFKLLGALLALSVCYLVAWKLLEDSHFTRVETDPLYQLEFLRLSWGMLRDSMVGGVFANTPEWLPRAVIASAVCVTVVGYTIVRDPGTIVVWGLLGIIFPSTCSRRVCLSTVQNTTVWRYPFSYTVITSSSYHLS